MHSTASSLTDESVTDGVLEQSFTVGEVPGVLFSPADATSPRPLILLGHGGGQHKRAPGVLARAHRFVRELGAAAACVDVPGHGDRPDHPQFGPMAARNQQRVEQGEPRAQVIAQFQAVVAQQTVPEWTAVLDALQELPHVGAGPVGYWGLSLGCGLGVPFVAAEPRVRAAVLGCGSALAGAEQAARITVPVQFLAQWDDEFISREQSLALFEAFASTDKTLHANPGGHAAVPRHEIDSATAFFGRHLEPLATAS
ncbi:dienelactone hydrolase family protein [Kineosporia rhizophila]|uniref:dienelactone hydrolase family protein n=1 Tax=Kineosporia rhizophila TaxID=84633 RepID=UPI001E54DC9A|nr:dienelactone hydrolase family protein [Kineosporia rhizophila]MCE0539538.1 dienelactone hydrolase family protein [Kineosporia rhizophila]